MASPREVQALLKPSALSLDAEAPLAAGGKLGPAYGSLPGVANLGIPSVCWYILIVEMCERLAFYTITGSQSFFLEHIGYPLANAGALNATMWTLCTVLAVVASWVADVALGRYATILCSGLLYVAGTALAALSAVPGKENSSSYFVAVMAMLPLATSGIKANISNFGADQYDDRDPAQAAAQEKFFSIFYCSINVGAALAFGFFTTFASSGGLGVPKAWGYASAYLAMAVCMGIAVLVFQLGRNKYKVHPLLQRSALASVLGQLAASAQCGSHKALSVLIGMFLLLVAIFLSAAKSMLPHTGTTMMVLAFVCALLGSVAVVVPCLNPTFVLRETSESNREQQEVSEFLGLLPVLFTGSISFNALYNCMQFWYAQQACQMDVRLPIGSGSFQLSGSFFNIADCLGIVAFTPIAVFWIDPYLRRMAHGHFSHGEKFSIGMVIACISVFVAARLEVIRRLAPVLSVTSNCAPPGVGMSDLSGAWMMLPFFLMGVAEIYTQPTLLHYAYSKSPPSMRTLAMAANFFIAAVSSALFALLVSAISPYMPNDLNKGHLEYGYYINIALGVGVLLPFLSILRAGHLAD